MVSRIYVEKKPGFDVEAQHLAHELRETLGIARLERLRLFNCYDVEGIDEELFERCVTTVFSEPQVDTVYRELPVHRGVRFAVEALPGQFDQRASSAAECIQLISQGERPHVRASKVYLLEGSLEPEDVHVIQHYVINPVESRLASLERPATLTTTVPEPAHIEVLEGFCALDAPALRALISERGFAMDEADIAFCQSYFRGEGRDPTITELRVIDTYWSDHCRHTTFGTELVDIQIDDATVQAAFERYLAVRQELSREDRPITLMDIATIGAKYLVAQGELTDLDESEEINACTVRCTVDVDGVDEDWLFLFKNETHNHPTEIEPFGGAATCIGGAIRDPLSGRAYVYQAMRVTGAADPTAPVSTTLAGKLPQRKLVVSAAAGYSSYGNQVGLATGQVCELYHPGYVAKRMEVGAVVGAAPACHVRRERPAAGDKVVLLGGRTGRDGIGGATGSSKTQNTESVETSGAEVQKGNAPIERKLQRLFRRGEVCRLIKRCNDFGAGGVSVAVGELAEGLVIDLDRVTKKYAGLDGTELAISESQERMAVALAPDDVPAFLAFAAEENLEAELIAEVQEEPRVLMKWQGEHIVDLSRAFLSSNGAPKRQIVHASLRHRWEPIVEGRNLKERFAALVSDLNVASNKGLAERFDSTIGAATVLMPFGGLTQLTPAQSMVAKFPVDGDTHTCSGMAWGFNPYLMCSDQFAGAYLSVVESISKLIATGFARKNIHLSFQEYFERLHKVPERWGKPLQALLGALMAQLDLGCAAIGGKDSMSGSFEREDTGEALDVPPTLISFAVATGRIEHICSPEFKAAKHRVVRIAPAAYGEDWRPDAHHLRACFDLVEHLCDTGAVAALATPGYGGCAEALFKMCVGNQLGLDICDDVDTETLFQPFYGSFLAELEDTQELPCAEGVIVEFLGTTSERYVLHIQGEDLELASLQELWEGALEEVFPYRSASCRTDTHASTPTLSSHAGAAHVYIGAHFAKPRVLIPVFPGTNCEYDTARAFQAAGALPDIFVIHNLTPTAVTESVSELVRRINASQIVMLPGGFSGGDEPDGAAKFITAFFRAPEVSEAVRDLLYSRDGLMLGICNGFQALVKLGLVPFGDIVDASADAPTLTFNTIGRHQSRLVHTRVVSTRSPWLSQCSPDEIYTVPISHGEGRFVARDELLDQLSARGQIAVQYVDRTGCARMDLDVNPNGSLWSIEGITSPDGRVFGKMGHVERRGEGLYQNVSGTTWMPIFESGVAYFA